jgi:hypothetical protein
MLNKLSHLVHVLLLRSSKISSLLLEKFAKIFIHLLPKIISQELFKFHQRDFDFILIDGNHASGYRLNFKNIQGMRV